jgi:hypothetical protein
MAANEEGRAVKVASIRRIVAGATFAARAKSRTVQFIAARAIRNCAPDTTIRVFDKIEASFRLKEASRRLARLGRQDRLVAARWQDSHHPVLDLRTADHGKALLAVIQWETGDAAVYTVARRPIRFFSDRSRPHGPCPARIDTWCPAGSQGLPPPNPPAPAPQARVRISWTLLFLALARARLECVAAGRTGSTRDPLVILVDQNASPVLSPN